MFGAAFRTPQATLGDNKEIESFKQSLEEFLSTASQRLTDQRGTSITYHHSDFLPFLFTVGGYMEERTAVALRQLRKTIPDQVYDFMMRRISVGLARARGLSRAMSRQEVHVWHSA